MGDKPRIVNIVATGRLAPELDIEKAFICLNCNEKIYEPEIYPALLIKIGEKRIHVTLYANGKYIIAGAKSEEEIVEAYKETIAKLEECEILKHG